MAVAPEYVLPDQEHPSDVEIWLEDGVAVLMRVATFGPTTELSPAEARQLGLAFLEPADNGMYGRLRSPRALTGQVENIPPAYPRPWRA